MNDIHNGHAVPIHLLTGFLGSGKTTLLTRILEHCREEGLKPAVIMNELGDINLDGQLIDGEVPMAEMLGGCICCSIRADLGMQIYDLMREHRPDILFIESTGAANPVEILDGIMEAAMYARVDLRSVITVVDGPELLARSRGGTSMTLKLMKEQIRCATRLLLNKADKLEPEELVEAQQLLRELNGYAPVIATVRAALDDWSWLAASEEPDAAVSARYGQPKEIPHAHGQEDSGHAHDHEDAAAPRDHAHPDAYPERLSGVRSGTATAGGRHEHDHDHAHTRSHAHESHEHVMALTYYMKGPVDSEAFEALLQGLPNNVYRAKGIVTFTDTASRFLFQFAYRESDYMRITPQGQVEDVAVFIGEHFDKGLLLAELGRLEAQSAGRKAESQ